MAEFTPFNPFPNSIQLVDSPKMESRIPQQDLKSAEKVNLENENDQMRPRRKIFIQYSDNHNMVKQLITTIKKMMKKHVQEIGSRSVSRQIIMQSWRIFENCKKPSKDILRAMFNKQFNKQLCDKEGFGFILNKYGMNEYQDAMSELKLEIIFRMRNQKLKNHFQGRTIQHKDRLVTYLQYFLEEQLKKGKISSRLNGSASKRMNQILQYNRHQDFGIDYCLQTDNEVFERFPSN